MYDCVELKPMTDGEKENLKELVKEQYRKPTLQELEDFFKCK